MSALGEKILLTMVKDCPNMGSGKCAFVHTCVIYTDTGEVSGMSETVTSNYADISVVMDLEGPDGNAFVILGRVAKAMRSAGATEEEVNAYQASATSGDYDNLLKVTGETVDFAASLSTL